MPEVTIIIPNYKTDRMTRLCLRLLAKHTDLDRVKVIAVDNDSADESLKYLRSVEWITLIERTDVAKEAPAEMHARALDLALEKTDTPYVLVMHTDTLIADDNWLDYLLSKIKDDDSVAGVGSWKLEQPSPLKEFGKKIEEVVRRLLGRRRTVEDRYLRSHAALYRTELLKKQTRGFFDGRTAGHSIHRLLVEKGYKMLFLESAELGKYVRHLNHATLILHPELGGKRTSKPKAMQRLLRQLDEFNYKQILADDSLDRRR